MKSEELERGKQGFLWELVTASAEAEGNIDGAL